MSFKAIATILLTLCLLETLSLPIQNVKTSEKLGPVFAYKTLVNSAVQVPNIFQSINARRVKRHLRMGPRCATDMREYADRCWSLEKYYELSGKGEKLKAALKQEHYEEEVKTLMHHFKKEWKQKRLRCVRKLLTI